VRVRAHGKQCGAAHQECSTFARSFFAMRHAELRFRPAQDAHRDRE
jgi:hypothetical protein